MNLYLFLCFFLLILLHCFHLGRGNRNYCISHNIAHILLNVIPKFLKGKDPTICITSHVDLDTVPKHVFVLNMKYLVQNINALSILSIFYVVAVSTCRQASVADSICSPVQDHSIKCCAELTTAILGPI